MSKYTTEVRFICETEAGMLDSVGYNDIDTVITNSRSKIFDFNYPLWDTAYKPVLEGKILRHFYTREIAYETYGLWKFKLATKLQEIMPYYNQLYETTVLEFNPLYDVNLTTTHTGEGTNTGTEETVLDGDVTKKTTGGYQDSNDLTKTETMNNMTSTDTMSGQDETVTSREGGNTRRDSFSDTPQGGITGVENNTYLTTYQKIVDDEDSTETQTTDYGRVNTNVKTGNIQTKDTGSSTRTYQNLQDKTTTDDTTTKTLDLANTDEYVHTVVGKSAGTSYAKLIEDFRKTLINIDMRIINDLNDLFFGLW